MVSGAGNPEMNDHKIQWLDTEYPTVMDDIDRLIEVNNADFPCGHATAELSERADAIMDRLEDLRRMKKTR